MDLRKTDPHQFTSRMSSKPLGQDTRELVKGLGRSVWRDRSRKSQWSFFCPLCKSPRSIPLCPRPQPRHYAQVLATAAVFTLATWSWFGLKGMVSFIPLWTCFEIVYRTKVRSSLLCQGCGFDPVLYLSDTKRARQVVESHWRKKFAEKGIPFPERTAPVPADQAQS